MEDDVFEVDEFAVDPQGCAGIGVILRSTHPAPTAERAMRSSRRVSATQPSKAGRIKALMLIFARS